MVEHRIHHSIAYLDDSVANSQDLRGVSSRGDPDLPFALPWWIKQRLQPGSKALHTCWPFALGCQHLQGYNHFALISSEADLLRATSLAWARSSCEEGENNPAKEVASAEQTQDLLQANASERSLTSESSRE